MSVPMDHVVPKDWSLARVLDEIRLTQIDSPATSTSLAALQARRDELDVDASTAALIDAHKRLWEAK